MIEKAPKEGVGRRTLTCRTVAHGRLGHAHQIRDLPVRASVTDPETLSMQDSEPNALELLLSALGACLSAGIHANAIARHIDLTSLSLELKAEVDDAVNWGTHDGAKPLGFEAITVSVLIEADAPAEALHALIKHATMWSPVANTLYNPVHLHVALH